MHSRAGMQQGHKEVSDLFKRSECKMFSHYFRKEAGFIENYPCNVLA